MTRFGFEKLGAHQNVNDFDCEAAALNRFLTMHALQSQRSNASQTYLCLTDDEVVGYFTLVVGQVEYIDSPERVRKGQARHPIPIMLLARLAVDAKWKGKGLGSSLLKEAAMRTLQVSDIAGVRAFVVHAKDDAAKNFYQHFGFVDGFSDSLQLYVLIKDLTALLK